MAPEILVKRLAVRLPREPPHGEHMSKTSNGSASGPELRSNANKSPLPSPALKEKNEKDGKTIDAGLRSLDHCECDQLFNIGGVSGLSSARRQ